VSGQTTYQAPSAVVTGDNQTSNPDLRRSISPIGIHPMLNEAVQRAAESLKVQESSSKETKPDAN
jgi:hypothetical protein